MAKTDEVGVICRQGFEPSAVLPIVGLDIKEI